MPGSNTRMSAPLDQSAPRMDRRLSNSSDTSLPDNSNFRQLSTENADYIPTRVTKVAAAKPAANPLQFIKVGPCNLYKSAQETLKKVEEVKKITLEEQQEEENWQSNLDNWKCSRRKRQEHIIERVVEVKKLELEEHDRNRRRSKTFNEMMEDRNGRGRKVSLVLYKDDDANDLSDLGIGTSSGKSSISEDYMNDDCHSVASDRDEMDKTNCDNHNGGERNGGRRKNGINGNHDDNDTFTTAAGSSPEPEEYTYERAIQSYVNFAETRVKLRTVSNKNIGGSEEELEDARMSSNSSSFEKLNNASHNGKNKYPLIPRRDSAPKIEARLFALEERRRSSTDLNAADRKKIPNVDVLKRRELFEKASMNNEPVSNKPNKSPRRVSGDLTTSKSIKERLSNLEKQNDDAPNEDMQSNKARKLSGEVTFTLKERMSNLGKSTENINGKESAVTKPRLSNGDLSPTRSVRERLSNLEKPTTEMEMKGQTQTRRSSVDIASSIKDVVMDGESGFSIKQADLHMTEAKQGNPEQQNKVAATSERCSSPEEEAIYQTRQQFHRSLDSLDVEASSDVGNEAFERVQSLEDLDCCGNARNYPASASSIEMLVFSSQSGDTDREDSGIHTADVSCSVSQADEPVEDGEIVATMSSIVPHIETDGNGANTYHLEVQIINHKRQESGICESLSPVNETEMTTAFLNVDGSEGSSMESAPMNAEHLGNDQSAQFKEAENDDCGDATEYETDLFTYNQNHKDMLIASKALETQLSAPANYFDSEGIIDMESQTERTKEQQRSDAGDKTFITEKTHHSNENGNALPIQIEEEIKKTEKEVQQLSERVKNKSNVQYNESLGESIAPVDTPYYGIMENDAEKIEIYYSINENQIPALNLSSDTQIVAGLNFPLGPPSASEPPKEKPPPPPMDLSDDDLPPRTTSLKRLDSTKRIRKEIRRKRSDFLGIEGNNDDNYLEPELKLAPPPDMTTYLVEEQRSEQQLYRQSICSETDSNLGETTESRDSGVELDRGHPDDLWSGKQTLSPDLSSQHSRQNSELYGNASTTSEEDEITKKEREIIEILEKEEQWRYGHNSTPEQNDIGEKLALKLRHLEQEKLRLEWERAEEENRRQAEAILRREEEQRLRTMEQQLRQQENNTVELQSSMSREQEAGEVLRAERERLQRESEELMRQKENLLLRESQQMHRGYMQEQQLQWNSAINLHHHQRQWDSNAPLPTHLSLQDISAPANGIVPYRVPQSCPAPPAAPINYRLSLPDLQQDLQIPTQHTRTSPVRRPPPPIPPAKPLKVVSQEQRERENSIRNSRMPSADIQHGDGSQCNQPYVQPGQQMSRQTLQALSAAPRSRLISTDTWMQAKRKPEAQRNGSRDNSSYNYQHWLIQEAEHRRITEQQQRNSTSPRKSSPPQHHPHHQQWNQSQMRPDKPLPDSIIQTLTQRVQNRVGLTEKNSPVRRRLDDVLNREPQIPVPSPSGHMPGLVVGNPQPIGNGDSQEKMLSVSGKKKCSHCGEELGRGAAMIIESLRLFYHIECFKCCVCHVQLGDGLMGTDVRVRNNKLHCHNCYSSDDGVKFSCV